MAWPTFAAVVSAAANELGLTTSAISDPFASTDKNVKQLNALLNALGQRIARGQPSWTQLRRTHYFPTVSGKNHYPLPSDFLRLCGQTVWNRTTDEKAAEGATPQEWRAIKDSTIGSASVYDVARIQGNRFFLHPEPSSAEVLAFDYQSAFWVAAGVSAWQSATAYAVGAYVTNDTSKAYVCVTAGISAASGGPTGTGDAIADNTAAWDFVAESGAQLPPTDQQSDTNTDALWFDVRVLVAGLKLAFKEAKGFDTASTLAEYMDAIAAAGGGDGMSPVLSLTPRGGSIRLLDGLNLPDTGYGA